MSGHCSCLLMARATVLFPQPGNPFITTNLMPAPYNHATIAAQVTIADALAPIFRSALPLF